MIVAASAFLVWLLQATLAADRPLLPPEPAGVNLKLDGHSIRATFAVSNSDDLVFDELSRRVLRIDIRTRQLQQSGYPPLTEIGNVLDGCVIPDDRIALLLDSKPPKIIEISKAGNTTVIRLPDKLGSPLSVAYWRDGTYFVTPSCAPELVDATAGLLARLAHLSVSRVFMSPGWATIAGSLPKRTSLPLIRLTRSSVSSRSGRALFKS